MDYTSPAISLLILWYGVYEYRRREKAHRAAVKHLGSGETLRTTGSGPRLWNLVATGSVCVLLAGFTGVLFYTGVHSRDNSSGTLRIMGGIITVPLLFLVLIFVRDVRRHAAALRQEKERGQ
jgi:high-affinity Fe2+/Pb2+ permease